MTALSSAPMNVVVTLAFPERVLAAIATVDPRIVVHHHPCDAGVTVPAELLKCAEVLYTSDFLPGPEHAPGLRWVQLDTSGIDHVRDTALWLGDATITTLGGISPAPLAEWVMMMVLAHAHRLRKTERLQDEHRWPTRAERWSQLMPRDLRSATLGIVGYGRIGHALAVRARAFGMTVVATRRDPRVRRADRHGLLPEIPEVRELPSSALHELLGLSDYIALTVPLTVETRGMLDAKALKLLRRGAVIINASRGGVVDEAALLAALDEGRIDLVASDVFDEEPLSADSPWWSHPRSVVTPHVAGFAPDYEDAVTALFAENLRRYVHGEALLNVADRQRGY